LLQLGADLEQAWHSDGATAATRKKILRMVIREIVVRVDGVLDLVIHWEGGDHTSLQVQKNKSGQHRWTTAADTVDLVKVLARQMPDKSITALLNRAGKKTGRGNSWTAGRVRALRDYHHIPVYREGERAERAEVTLDEAAAILKVSPSTIRRLIATDVLPASQLCKGAPWIIKSADLNRDEVKNAAAARRLRRPLSQSPDQITLQLQ
jgi:excisionase family DNA binding protein